MKKWLIKHKDDIIKNSISGAIVLVFGMFLNFLLGLVSQNQNIALNFIKELLQFSIKIPAYILILFFVVTIIISKVSNLIRDRNRKLKIIKAIYYTDMHSIDITSELNNAIEENKLKIVLSNNIAGDPHKGTLKGGRIKYKFNGQENTKEYQEGSLIQLP